MGQCQTIKIIGISPTCVPSTFISPATGPFFSALATITVTVGPGTIMIAKHAKAKVRYWAMVILLSFLSRTSLLHVVQDAQNTTRKIKHFSEKYRVLQSLDKVRYLIHSFLNLPDEQNLIDKIGRIKSKAARKIAKDSEPVFDLKAKVDKRLKEELGFFKLWLENPKVVGAVLPTSKATAARMAQVARVGANRHVLELGPGSGIITKALLAQGIKPENLYLIEFTQKFVSRLQTDFPDINIIHGDAFQIKKTLKGKFQKKFDTVISGLPLLNYPVEQRIELLEEALEVLEPGRPLVQFSYGFKAPIPPNPERYRVKCLDWMVRNIPPARLWVYTRIDP